MVNKQRQLLRWRSPSIPLSQGLCIFSYATAYREFIGRKLSVLLKRGGTLCLTYLQVFVQVACARRRPERNQQSKPSTLGKTFSSWSTRFLHSGRKEKAEIVLQSIPGMGLPVNRTGHIMFGSHCKTKWGLSLLNNDYESDTKSRALTKEGSFQVQGHVLVPSGEPTESPAASQAEV